MGVVYHANYLVWCEVARTELIRRRFVSYAEVEKSGVLLAVAEASIRYHSPARYDELVRVRAWLSRVRSRTVTFDYLIERVDDDGVGELLATASTKLIAIGRDSRPMKLPSDLMTALTNA
jgi:acyl-CoA thioester hydrolase